MISSTNVVEGIIREIRLRSRARGVFHSQDSYVRLITSYFIEDSGEWINGRSFIKQQRLIVALDEDKVHVETQDEEFAMVILRTFTDMT